MSEAPDPLIGSVIRDCTLLRLVGRGAMGVIYQARDRKTGEEVAVKLLSAEFASRKEFINRFMNEAAASASLNHENVIRVFAAGQEEGIYYMIMEFVDGVDLGYYLQTQKNVREAQVLPWIKGAAKGLGYAHSQGIIHRDLKPENIMLTHDGRVKLADLGLSKNIGVDENFSMTMSGTVIGTPYYISPEQARDSKRVDPRTDMYSLGATFYHLIAGFPPFSGNSAAEVMAKHMNEALVDPQRHNVGISDALSDLIMKMMEKDPHQRFQTMEELVLAVERIERGEKVIEKKVRLKRDALADSVVRRNLASLSPFQIKLLIGALGFAAVLILGLLWTRPSPHQTTPPPAPPSLSLSSKPSLQQPSPPISHSPQAPSSSPSPALSINPPPSSQEIPNPPQKPRRKSHPSKPVEEFEELRIDGSSSFGSSSSAMGAHGFNWVDGFGIIALFLGIPMARKVGWWWGSLRAFAFWVATWIICTYFFPFGQWIKVNLVVPEGVAIGAAFLALSVITLLPALIFTHRLDGQKKETWQLKLNRTVAILPGIILGMAFAAWFFALLAVFVSTSFPLAGSWVGSHLLKTFPAIQQVVEMDAKSVKH